MRPAFAITRQVERRASNPQITSSEGSSYTQTRTLYEIMVTRVIFLWVTVWVHETEYT